MSDVEAIPCIRFQDIENEIIETRRGEPVLKCVECKKCIKSEPSHCEVVGLLCLCPFGRFFRILPIHRRRHLWTR